MITEFRMQSIARIAALALLVACKATEQPTIPTHLSFEAQPTASVTSTQPLGIVTVVMMTADGRRAVAGTGNVQISLMSNDGESHLSGAQSSQAADGVATFSDLSVDKAGTAYRLVATAVGLDSAMSQPFSVVVGPAARLRFDAAIGSQLAGNPMPPVSVSVTDAGGNLVTAATASIRLSDSPGTLYGTTTAPAVNGTAVFSDLSIQKSMGNSLLASAPNLVSATSNIFFVQPLRCSEVGIRSQPSDTRIGTPLPAIVVYCADVYGNPPSLPPAGSLTVTAALGINPTGATLSGTTTASGFGIWTEFDSLIVDKPGTGYTLTVSSAGLASGTTKAFNILP
ncbi:MAG TPA: hypothetical protein VJU87_11500 [Gemmatimonadaceae bacterium]|nr:hypothetical protein [Gemmatimonadaceae bacterium]